MRHDIVHLDSCGTFGGNNCPIFYPEDVRSKLDSVTKLIHGVTYLKISLSYLQLREP